MGIASQSGAVVTVTKSGYSMGAWGLYGYAEHNTGANGLIAFVYRRAFKTDAYGGTALSFTLSGVSTRVWDGFYATWMSVNASGASVSVADMRPWYYLSTSSSYDASASRQRATVSGTTYTGSVSQKLSPNTTYYLYLATPAAGAVNGSLSLSVTGVYGTAASPSLSAGYFGEAVPITLTGGSGGGKYTVTVSCAGKTETLQTKASTTALSWTPALAVYAALLPSRASATATVTVDSFYSGVSVGTKSASVTLRFRAGSLPPTLSSGWYTLSPYNAGTAAAAVSGYVAGYSRAAAVFDAAKVSCLYGASVKSFTLTALGESVASSPWRTPVLREAASVRLTVTDSRGQTASRAVTVTPMDYAAPRLVSPSFARCDALGVSDGDGLYYRARATASCSPLNGQNRTWLYTAWRPVGGTWSADVPLDENGSAIVGTLDPDRSYELRITVEDLLGNTAQRVERLPTRKWAMKFREDGDGVAFGMAAEHAKCLEIPDDWELRRGGRALPWETYAVGDLFLTTRAGNPAALLGYGAWTQIQDRFLLAAGGSFAAGATGGAAAHTLTAAQLPKVSGSFRIRRYHTQTGAIGTQVLNPTGAFSAESTASATQGIGTASSGEDGYQTVSLAFGEGAAHNNMPPYLAVYVWKRIA